MEYKNIHKGIFLSRSNRFIAEVTVEGKTQKVHVKNTGRCKELLIPGCTVFLEKTDNSARKTAYDLVAVYKGERLINMDSQAPNKVAGEWFKSCGLFKNITLIKPEYTFWNSRFDFYLEAEGKKILAEVKGVTLEENGIVKFPDAPTLRGIKHINQLAAAVKEGYECYIIFVVQMNGAEYFTPNNLTQPEFGKALLAAEKSGVKVIAFDCDVTPSTITADGYVQICL